MRTSVLDSPDIGEIARRNEAERLSNIALCNCKRPDGGGEVDRSQCPIHRDPLKPEGCCLAPLQQQRVPDDDWKTLKQQAQCPAAAFLQDLHLRIESRSRRVITREMRTVTGQVFHVVTEVR